MYHSKVCLYQAHLFPSLQIILHQAQPAIFFSILLINITSLFTNALPAADGPLSSRTSPPLQAQAVAFNVLFCVEANAQNLYTAIILTRDICASFPTTASSTTAGVYLSGAAAEINIDSTHFDCRISFYVGSTCSGSPVGETATIGPNGGLGPCVNFNLQPSALSTVQVGADSALLTCKPI